MNDLVVCRLASGETPSPELEAWLQEVSAGVAAAWLQEVADRVAAAVDLDALEQMLSDLEVFGTGKYFIAKEQYGR